MIEGTGAAFCTGADLPDAQTECIATAALIDAANPLILTIIDYRVPVIAAVHSPAAGFGVSLALACDLVLAAESGYFLLAFTKVGLMPDGGATELVATSIGRARAMRMALLAERISAREAFECGLISHTCPDEAFDSTLEKMLHTLGHGPFDALRHTKDTIDQTTLTGLDAAFGRERSGQVELITSPDFAEGSAALRSKRPAMFR